jgi:molybdate transport system substrate-binding protein
VRVRSSAGRVGPSVVLPAVLAVMLSAGCADGATATRELVVSAAASLGPVLEDVALAFEEARPDVDVVLNLGGSSTLREQVLAGAPADVFLSADVANAQAVADAGLAAAGPTVFATNRLVVVVPPGNPAGVTGLESFADPDLVLGLCAPAVPCGTFARQALDAAGIVPVLDTEEPDVRALVTKVAAGELDAGVAYATDLAAAAGAGAAGAVEGIDLP